MTTHLRWPAALVPGDRVSVAATSSRLTESSALERLQAGIHILQSWGLDVDPHQVHRRQWGYLAGRDQDRRADLLQAGRRGAGMVACLRGGWGAARLLEGRLDLPPRWLLGFSDVTSLLWAQVAQGHGGSVHGPLLTSLAAEPSWSQERLRQVLFGEQPKPLEGDGWYGGQAEGSLLVGNLTVATHLLGTPHMPQLRDVILIFEDVGEAPYRLDRMLTHWRLSGALDHVAAIGFGQFTDCQEPETLPTSEQSDDKGFSVEEVLRERVSGLGIPVLAGLPVGHGPINAALPLGCRARLDAKAGRLELLP